MYLEQKGVEECYEAEVTEQSKVIYGKHKVEGETKHNLNKYRYRNEKTSEIENVVDNNESCGVEQAVITDEENHCAAVQTRAAENRTDTEEILGIG